MKTLIYYRGNINLNNDGILIFHSTWIWIGFLAVITHGSFSRSSARPARFDDDDDDVDDDVDADDVGDDNDDDDDDDEGEREEVFDFRFFCEAPFSINIAGVIISVLIFIVIIIASSGHIRHFSHYRLRLQLFILVAVKQWLLYTISSYYYYHHYYFILIILIIIILLLLSSL